MVTKHKYTVNLTGITHEQALSDAVQHGDHHTIEKEAGWEEWLHKHRLSDDALDKDTLHTRYLKFSRMNFRVIPTEDWWCFFHNLLPFEEELAFREGIGKVTCWPFHFHVHDKHLSGRSLFSMEQLSGCGCASRWRNK